MALTQQDYKNIYSMLPTNKNEKGDSTLGLGKMVENLVPPFEEWVCEITTKEVPYAYFFLPTLKGMYQCQFFPTDKVDVVQMPLISQKLSLMTIRLSKSSPVFKSSQHKIRCWFDNILYTELNFEWRLQEGSSGNRCLKISLIGDNNILEIGSFTFRYEDNEYYHWNTKATETWKYDIGSFALIYFEDDFSYDHFLNYFFEKTSSNTSFFPTTPSLRQFNSSDVVLRVREPGSYLNTRSLFYHKEKRPLDLHLCVFKTNFPWIVDLNNTIIGADLHEPYYQIETLDKLEKELPTQNIKSWFDSVDFEIAEWGGLYAINPLYENKELLSSNTITMTVGGVNRNGVIKLVPNRIYLTSQEQNSNYVSTESSQVVYHINQNATRYLRQIYNKKKDTAENKKNKGTEKYIKPRTWIYWPQATVEEQKILLCSGDLVDLDNNIYDNSWSDFRLLSKNDGKEENYTSIEYVWVFIYKTEENQTKYLPLGKSQPIIINKDSTNEGVSIQKVFGDEYYSNTYIFID